jgi:uncharacterized membrane protein HdeD (DUF308 family)
MNNALKCALMLTVGLLAIALPTMAGVVSPIPHVPEPGTLVLLAGGLITVVGARKLRKN